MSEPLMSGPCYSQPIKALATLLVVALALAASRAMQPLVDGALPAPAWAFIAAALVVIGASFSALLRARIVLDAHHVREHGLWRKQAALADMTQLKLVCVPGLSWLIAPRLVVQVRGRGRMVFHAAEEALLREVVRRALAAQALDAAGGGADARRG